MPIDATFLPGLELSRALYEEAVRPLLAAACPRLPHSAARIGSGSEVLGFDTARSADHDWGPQLQLFLPADAVAAQGDAIHRLLAERMPDAVRGWPTRYRESGDPGDPVGHLDFTGEPLSHRVHPVDPAAWFRERLGVDPTAGELSVRNWLAVPQQALAEVTGGAVFHDGLGVLGPVRERLAWYPDQVWRHLLGCQWQKLSQEEAFVGRTAEVGDDLGSAVAAARQVRELMRLALLQARRYAPYTKWLGSAFARDVPDAARLGATLRGVLAATTYADRENELCAAYEELARRQNALGLTAGPVDPTRRPYRSRPFQVIRADRFADALLATVDDPELKALPPTGSVDQWADSTDFLGRVATSAPGS
ncbi:DUF4037 domain-containing protein [Streptomyces beijiangensis]|uniref:DUF4037 domain-containing protein n=1 Tax=Streptomyces beijiangensis TaxID=163361 RepID=A0A939JJQ7_9ACTN|nr:DUF4037 domain-containing protein [Streptomyces beijiangensis]MBO0513889.1 DUF4037 domain-containing protein [Streptomyces beijiangensis]